ncbi:MAG: redox-sensitive transcriptional activator SoxR [Actinomycetota bacterium]
MSTSTGDNLLPIGEVAERTGLAVSAIRFYEEQGLIEPTARRGGKRVFERSAIRRLSFILITQQLGYSLADIRTALDRLPNASPTADDWAGLARSFRNDLDGRIERLGRLRDRLDGCIGCGCLSLQACGIYNPGDRVRVDGRGPRMLIDP